MNKGVLSGLYLKNFKLFIEARIIGFDYLLNPETDELHRVRSDFYSSHNLHSANLGNFIGLTNVGYYTMEQLFNGSEIPVYDILTGDVLGVYVLNKCRHCFN